MGEETKVAGKPQKKRNSGDVGKDTNSAFKEDVI
jgi:hypothetical protein